MFVVPKKVHQEKICFRKIIKSRHVRVFLNEFLAFILSEFVLKLHVRENMKLIKRFLLLVMCAMPVFAQAQVATTAGSNLTAWNGNSGATNNNNWNQMMNNRTMATGGGAAPTADFGNCNSLILRCAQPKCAGCTTVDIARPIVAGCVNSNATCKKYGDDLIEFISAQMVSNANSKAQQQQIAAQQAAAQAAAAQNSAQMAQMQQQMQQMQYEMQQQNAQQMAQMQAALDEQKQIAAAAQAAAVQQATMSNAATVDNVADGLTQQQLDAARGGVPEEIMLRQQVSGQILTKIDNADVLLKNLKATMEEAFAYAGCDTRGNNCSAPKRVKVFKDKAQKFFEPYDDIVDETYDALETALAVGVDVSDVIMMLSGSCNKWGKFLCTGVGEKHVVATYTPDSCPAGKSIKGAATKVGSDDENASAVKTGNLECTIGMAVPPQDDVRCTLVGIIDEDVNGGEGVYREWLDENYEGDRLVRVGCATSALESISVFGRRTSRSGATLDLDVLERILAQDAPDYGTVNRYMRAGSGDERVDRTKYCALTEKGYQTLLRAVQTKKLPDKICVTDKQLIQHANTGGALVGMCRRPMKRCAIIMVIGRPMQIMVVEHGGIRTHPDVWLREIPIADLFKCVMMRMAYVSSRYHCRGRPPQMVIRGQMNMTELMNWKRVYFMRNRTI